MGRDFDGGKGRFRGGWLYCFCEGMWVGMTVDSGAGGCGLWVVNSVWVCVAFLSCKVSKGGCGLWGVKSVWVDVAFEKSVWVGVTFEKSVWVGVAFEVKSHYGWKASEVWGQYLWVWPLRCEVSICGCDLWDVKSLFVLWPLRCEVSMVGCGLWGVKSVTVGVAFEVRSQ